MKFLTKTKLSFLWPIKSNELLKFSLMGLLMFVILLNQNLIRGMKDSIVTTMIGVETISFIKIWLEMPIGVLFVLSYYKLCNIMSTEQVFRLIVLIFLLLFAIFVFVIFPNQDLFHPSVKVINEYLMLYPRLQWFIVLWSKWDLVLFYVFGELWPVITFFLLFWQLANKITSTDEAKRFYTLFNLFGQTNLLFSGSILIYFTSEDNIFSSLFGVYCNKADVSIRSITILVLISGVMCIFLNKLIENKIIKKGLIQKDNKNETLKLGIWQSIKITLSSGYLGKICLLMICYSISVNLIEGLWMSSAKELYPTMSQFMNYQGKVLFATGLATLLCSFLGSIIIARFGWYAGAILTPLSIIIAGGSFFLLVIFKDYLVEIFTLSSNKIMFVIVLFGALQNVIGKGVKYSMFDSTKEMLYIPLNNELKTKGKAAVDILGAKIGKFSGASVQALAFIIIPSSSYQDLSLILAVMFFITCIIWIIALNSISNSYYKICSPY
jgi:ADP/ATP carrier protein family